MKNTEAVKDSKKVKFEFVETNFFRRWPCHICGGTTEKENILCEVLEGEYKGIRICEFCLQSGNIESRLSKYIESLEGEVEGLRALVGRLDIPTYEQWQAKNDEVDRKWQKRREAEVAL